MKTLILFISIFVVQLTAQSQEYIGIKFKDLVNNNQKNPDKRYNLDSMIYSSTGADSLLFRFFHSTFAEYRTYGTAVFYKAYTDSAIIMQRFLYYNNHMDYVHKEFIRLSNKGYKVTFERIDDIRCLLEIKR